MIMWGLPPEALEDCFRPPDEPCLVRCLHCGEEYTSDRIVWRRDPDGQGFWCCPVDGCDGIGYTFDIHPIDGPDGEYVGWSCFDDEDYDEEDEDFEEDFGEEFGEEFDASEDDVPW